MAERDEAMVLAHTSLLATIDGRSKSNSKRLDNFEKLVLSVHELSLGLTKLVISIEQQSRDLTIMVKTLESHEQKIDSIESKMETKETVSRLHGRMEELQKMMTDKESTQREQKLSEYDDMKKFMIKTLGGAAIFVVSAIAVFGAAVLTALAKSGTLLIP